MAFGLSAGAGALIGTLAAPLLMGDNGAGDANSAAAYASNKQAQIAGEQWDRYKSTYAPLEDKMVADAQKYETPENFARAAGDASSTVSEQFGKARDRLTRTPGLDPSSGAYQSSVVGLDLAQAATDATQQNAARQGVKDRGYARKLDALSLGKGLPAQATGGFNAAAGNSLDQARYGTSVTNTQANALGNVANRAISAWASGGRGGGAVNLGSVTGADMDIAF